MATFQHQLFSISLPKTWKVNEENNIFNFFPLEDFGAVTISIHTGINFPLDKTKEFVLGMNKIKDDPNRVKVTRKGRITEFLYEHIDGELNWVTKVIRTNDDICYILTINCDSKKWDAEQETFRQVLESFEVKSN